MWKSIQSVAAASFAVSQEAFTTSKKKDGICHFSLHHYSIVIPFVIQ
jgi:hypothetical protein